jgi:RNA polymerase sigma factor (sigma-70 family)
MNTLIHISDRDFKSEFERIYTSYKNRVFSILKKIINCTQTAEDLTHEVFIRIIEKWPKFNNVDTPGERSYISRIAVNCAKDYIRKKGREQRKHDKIAFQDITLSPEFYINIEDLYIEGEVQETLYDAIQSLSGMEQKVMVEKIICENRDYHITRRNKISHYMLKKIEQKVSDRIRDKFMDYLS